jgi:hypothetical protein
MRGLKDLGMARPRNVLFFSAASIAAILFVFSPSRRGVLADEVPVRYAEGISRGFLVLRTLDGKQIAQGESFQTASDEKVKSRLVFRFKDGSLYDDTTDFTERGTFHLLSDHLIQKGPAFNTPLETSIDTTTGSVTVRYSERGKPRTLQKKMDLPPDLANGMLLTIVKNIRSQPMTPVSYLATTPKPQIVKLVFSEEGKENLWIGSSTERAARYVMKIEIGGLKGAVARILKKTPPDTRFWILDGAVPSYAGSEGPLYADGPVWQIALVSPSRSESSDAQPK